jgi:hypothetical protein
VAGRPSEAGVFAGHHPELAQQLVQIGDAFVELEDAAKREREKFRELARKGNYSAISEVPDRLLKPPHTQQHTVGGALTTIEIAIRAYREQRLAELT